MPWAFMAWSHAPDSDYGVVTVADQEALKADADAIAEKILTGYVDLFTRDQTSDSMDAIESVLRGLGLWFRLESIQFEEDTGYIHYEWTWADTNGSASEDVALIRFDIDGVITEQWLPYGATPTPPAFTPIYENNSGVSDGGVWIVIGEWSAPITPVNGNAEYVAHMGVEVGLISDKCLNEKETSPISAAGYPTQFVLWTQEAYDLMKQAFEAGYMVCNHSSTGYLNWYMTELNGLTAVFVQPGSTQGMSYTIDME